MNRRQKIAIALTAITLLTSVSSCSWMSDTMSRAKERVSAMRERMKVARAERAQHAAAEQPAAPVATTNAPGIVPSGAHVIAGTGKPIADAAGECVSVGHSAGAGHGGGCGGEMVAVDAAPAAVVRAPIVEQPIVTGAEVRDQALPHAEQFPPASEPVATATPSAPPPVAAVAVAPAPAAVAAVQPALTPETPAPAAPPVVDQAMPKPPASAKPAEQFTLASDALFKFGKYNEGSMSAAGKKRLAEFAAHIKRMDPAAVQKIAITGHADRLGSAERNQFISERRAQTVKGYLAKLGVDPSLMSATGKGKLEPVVQCSGNKRTAKLKACLAPNRRVEVALFGLGDKLAHSK